MLLFAYGTLKDPGRLAAVIGGATKCRRIGDGSIGGILYDAGGYPVLVPSQAAADTVPGVVLELDDTALPQLDDYEGVDSGLYTRQWCAVRLADGTTVQAWVYVYARPVTALPRIAAWPPHPD